MSILKITLGILFFMSLPINATVVSENIVTENFNSADTTRVIDLDELVVVARPKEIGRLRSLPISSNVVTNKEILSLGISDLSSLSSFVPSFCVPSYGSRLTSSIYVRGIGSRAGSPTVGVYYDGMPIISKSAINSHSYQLDRVDVLRGPQGTLYGINAESGIVRIYSKNPLSYQGTDIRMSLGTGLCGNIEVAQYHRPSDKIAFSTAGYYSGQRGFFKNTYLDEHADLVNEAGGKARLIYLPNDKLKFDITADYQYTNQNGFAYGLYEEETKSFHDAAMNIMNGYKRQMINAAVNISYDFGTLQLSSVSSYQHLADLMQMDQDYLPEDYLRLGQRERMNALVQEITLSGRRNEYWRHTSGVFFSNQWLNTVAPVYFGDDMNTAIIKAMGVPSRVASSLSITDNNVPGEFDTPQLNLGLYHESNVKLASKLILTLGLRYDYQRVSIDYNTQSNFKLNYTGIVQGRPFNVSNRFASILSGNDACNYSQFLPKLGVTYNVGNNGNVLYATFSKGFRSGGYNIQMFSDIFSTEQRGLGKELMQLMRGDMSIEHNLSDYENIDRTISYEPETSWNYEAGTHLNLFDNRFQADASLFYMQIRNQQLSVMAGNYGYGRMMVNAGRSRSIGAELTLRGVLDDGRLSWNFTYGYVHSTFRSYRDNVPVVTANGLEYEQRDYRGRYVPFVPKHTFSAIADYHIPLSTRKLLKSLTVGANVSGNGNVYWNVENSSSQDFYLVPGAHVLFDLGAININIWGRNLSDTKYNTFLVQSSIDGITRSFSQRGNPIQAGIDVGIRIK